MPFSCLTKYPKCCQLRFCCLELGMNRYGEDHCKAQWLCWTSEVDKRTHECQIYCWQCGDFPKDQKSCACDMPRCCGTRCCCFRTGLSRCYGFGDDDCCRTKCCWCHNDVDNNIPSCQICCLACLKTGFVFEPDVADEGDPKKEPMKQTMADGTKGAAAPAAAKA